MLLYPNSLQWRGALLLALLSMIWVVKARAVVWPLPPGTEVVGELLHDRMRPGDTLLDMARMHDMGVLEMRAANPDLDPWLAYPGRDVLVPQLHVLPEIERQGIVVNLSERRLYYFAAKWPDYDGPVVVTNPVGIGLMDRSTPLLNTEVVARLENPAWYPTQKVREWYLREKNERLPAMVPPGPENPLGSHALILADQDLMIHGTHRPAGVGMRVSQGCIRLYPESIAALIHQVPVGTPVTIISQPIRLGWRDGRLYLEVDPAEGDDLERFEPGAWPRHPESLWLQLRERLDAIEGTAGARVDLDAARAAFDRADGIPVVVGSRQATPVGEN
ncbi:MAG: L,D-transpeptidase family protein [Wenzhouxiangellaceae bacterium]